MDPNATLAAIRRLSKMLIRQAEENRVNYAPAQDDLLDTASTLAENCQNLDEWLMKGGFLPSDWQKEQAR
jgi:hypothetical protein